MLNSWMKFKDKLIIDDVLKSPLFYNKHVKIGRDAIYYDNWHKKGVRFVNVLLKGNGKFYSFQEFPDILEIKENYLQYWGTINAVKTY